MRHVCKKMFFHCLWIAFFVIFLNACGTSGGAGVDWGKEDGTYRSNDGKKAKKGGPPPHAPAHGYRAKYRYRYYPSSHVYYDVDRRLYFYLKGDDWQVAASLPRGIRVSYGDSVRIEMASDKPYTEYETHKAKYPPGQLKKNKKSKKNKKNKT